MPTEIPSLPIRPGCIQPTEAHREVFRQINARLMEPWGDDEYERVVHTGQDVSAVFVWWLLRCYEAAGWSGLTAPDYLVFTRPTTACAIQTADQFPRGVK